MSNNQRSPFNEGKINFLGSRHIFGGISAILVIACLIIIGTRGLNYGIDFAGGTEVQVKFNESVDTGQIRDFLSGLNLSSAQVQSFGDQNEFLIRFETIQGKTDKETNELLTQRIETVTGGLKSNFAAKVPDIRRVDSVGPQVGSQLKRNGVLAVFYSLLLILIYVGLRFDYNFAPGAVVCLFHDSIITLGLLSILGKEINIQILAAILTIIGYSLNDTIVVYDRIRENTLSLKGNSLTAIINRSINDTLSRTVLTSVTTLLAVVALIIFAGGVIKDFAFALFIGVIVGTYSSIYVASPLTIVFEKFKNFGTRKA